MSKELSKAPETQKAVSEGRRSFLKLAALGAPAAVAAAAGGEAAQAAPAPGPNAAGYRKTDHVKKYLDTARF